MAKNRINISISDTQLVQLDMLAELNGMDRSAYLTMLINGEFAHESTIGGRIESSDMFDRLEAFIASKHR